LDAINGGEFLKKTKRGILYAEIAANIGHINIGKKQNAGCPAK
jgi:hypothetical protein